MSRTVRLVFPGLCFGLGAWQLCRWRSKRCLLADIEAGLGLPPVLLDALPEDLGPLRYRRLRLRGARLGEQTVLVGPRAARAALPAEPFATMVIAPLSDGRSRRALVNLGWAPYGPAPAVRVDPAECTFVLDRTERPSWFAAQNDPARGVWRWKVVDQLAAHLGTEPVMLKRIDRGDRAIVPSPTTFEIPNRHLEYILTWFGLGVATSLLAVLKR